MQQHELTNNDLMRLTPSVFATEAAHTASGRYTFIPTIDVVEALRKEGFVPVYAQQTKAMAANKGFTKHMLRFRQLGNITDLPKGVNGNAHHIYSPEEARLIPEVPELVLVNSHDRTSTYQLDAGLFRQVCSNGLMVKSGNIGGIRARHLGNIVEQVLEGSFRIIEEMPKVIERVAEFKDIFLDEQQSLAFADAALQLRYPLDDKQNSTAPIQPRQLLQAYRPQDQGKDLWTTYNVIQENFMKGGQRGLTRTGKRTKLRGITSVTEDIKLNQGLWSLTEAVASLAH